jgi:hypothetical protein
MASGRAGGPPAPLQVTVERGGGPEPAQAAAVRFLAALGELGADPLRAAGRAQLRQDFIAHHQAVMAHADWIIDLGPGAGHDGGRVVFAGTPADLVAHGDMLTARHLRAYLDQ